MSGYKNSITDINGFVGIGEPAPISNLHIKTSVDNSVAQGLVIERSANSDKGYINYNGGGFQFRSTVGDPIVFGETDAEHMRIIPDGNVFVGGTTTTNSQSWGRQIASINSGSNGASLTLKDSNGEWQLATYTDKFWLTKGATTTLLIDSLGKVGIGTITPSEKLHVVGNIKVDGSVGVTNIVTNTIVKFNGSILDDSQLYDNGTNVGIATTNPKSKLHVAKSGNSNGGSLLIGLGGSGTNKWSFLAGSHYNQDSGSGNGSGAAGIALIGSFSTLTENQVYIGGNPYELNAATSITFNTHTSNTSILGGSPRMHIDSSGLVGIGTTAPSSKLQVEGDFNIANKYIYHQGYTSTTGAGVVNGTSIEWKNGTTAINTAYNYRVRLTTAGTGTNSGATYLVEYSPDTDTYNTRMVSRSGSDSNHPLLAVSGATMIAYTNHTTAYPIQYHVESISVADNDGTLHNMGADYHWQRDVDNLYYEDGNVGIGTTSPGNKLNIYQDNTSTSPAVRIENNGTGDASMTFVKTAVHGWTIGLDNSDSYKFKLSNSSGDVGGGTAALTVDTSFRVGIGTTSPSTKLHVVGGDIYTDSQFRLNQGQGITWNNGDNYIKGISGYHLQFTTYDGASAQQEVLRLTGGASVSGGGRVGIGTTTPDYKLDVNGTGRFGDYLISNNYTGSTLGSGGLYLSGDPTPDFAYLGYNYTNVSGTESVYQSIRESWRIRFGNGATKSMSFGMRVGSAAASAWSEYLSIVSGGNVGIGATSPAQKLDVAGNILADTWISTDTTSTRSKFSLWGGDGAYAIGMSSGYSYGYLGGTSTGTDYAMSFQMNNSSTRGFWWGDTTHTNAQGAMSLTTDGKLMVASLASIGYGETATTPPTTYALDVNGTIRATGDVIAYSDARVKENVNTIGNALEKVISMRGVEYNKIGETEQKIGVIAQEIEKVLPQVVQEDSNGMKSVAYGNIVGVLIEAIKEQQKQIDELKAIINGGTK